VLATVREEGDGVLMSRTPIRSRMQSTKSCARIVGSAGEVVVARPRRMQFLRPERHLGAMPLLVMHAHSGTSPAFVVCAQAVVRYGTWIT
jgi:hypothetical protein